MERKQRRGNANERGSRRSYPGRTQHGQDTEVQIDEETWSDSAHGGSPTT